MTRQRLLIDLVLLISVLFLPWWISVTMAVVALFSLTRFWEIIVFMLAIDLLYGAPAESFRAYPFWLTSGALIALPTVEWLKLRLRI